VAREQDVAFALGDAATKRADLIVTNGAAQVFAMDVAIVHGASTEHDIRDKWAKRKSVLYGLGDAAEGAKLPGGELFVPAIIDGYGQPCKALQEFLTSVIDDTARRMSCDIGSSTWAVHRALTERLVRASVQAAWARGEARVLKACLPPNGEG
jgi:hypothetical protein